jgi:hypothetical protein
MTLISVFKDACGLLIYETNRLFMLGFVLNLKTFWCKSMFSLSLYLSIYLAQTQIKEAEYNFQTKEIFFFFYKKE